MQQNLQPDSSSDPSVTADSLTATDVTAGSSPVTDVQADSSKANGDAEDSLLSVVRSVIEPKPTGAGESQADGEGGQQAGSQPADEKGQKEQPDEAKDDNFTDVAFGKHPRFQELLGHRNRLRQQVQDLEPDAQQYRQIQSFMDQSGLTPQEVAEGLMLMAEMKSGDPAKAYEALSKKVETLALASGKKLPQELEERVAQGYVDRETAEQMYRAQLQQAREAANAKRQLEQREARDAAESAQSVQSAVASWEAQVRSDDPDYSIKADLVKDRLRAEIAAKGIPKTPDEAVQLAKAAYDDVSKKLAKVRGPRQEIRQPVGGKVNGSVAPEPRNLLEVIQRTVGV
jgi:cell division septum initiation protein DivIVA